ncbi:MAG TPA: glycosyltransferase, partial [Polyangiaceae bacterium]|nr:glycosyltransferase [Polyangiaceae bacterium]
MTDFSQSLELSVVAPMYNEEGNIAAFVGAVDKVVATLGVSFEIILVDDGSSDGTWSQIVEQTKHFPALRGARLARNFGHQGALMAGLHEARGKAVV